MSQHTNPSARTRTRTNRITHILAATATAIAISAGALSTGVTSASAYTDAGYNTINSTVICNNYTRTLTFEVTSQSLYTDNAWYRMWINVNGQWVPSAWRLAPRPYTNVYWEVPATARGQVQVYTEYSIRGRGGWQYTVGITQGPAFYANYDAYGRCWFF